MYCQKQLKAVDYVTCCPATTVKIYQLENNAFSSTPFYEFNKQTAFCTRCDFYSSLICFVKPKSKETFLYNVWNNIHILLSVEVISIAHKQKRPQTTKYLYLAHSRWHRVTLKSKGKAILVQALRVPGG